MKSRFTTASGHRFRIHRARRTWADAGLLAELIRCSSPRSAVRCTSSGHPIRTKWQRQIAMRTESPAAHGTSWRSGSCHHVLMRLATRNGVRRSPRSSMGNTSTLTWGFRPVQGRRPPPAKTSTWRTTTSIRPTILTGSSLPGRSCCRNTTTRFNSGTSASIPAGFRRIPRLGNVYIMPLQRSAMLRLQVLRVPHPPRVLRPPPVLQVPRGHRVHPELRVRRAPNYTTRLRSKKAKVSENGGFLCSPSFEGVPIPRSFR